MKMMSEKIAKEGSRGRLELALSIERGERMIVRYLQGSSLPPSNIAYKLAKACGATDQEAQRIANESFPGTDTKSA